MLLNLEIKMPQLKVDQLQETVAFGQRMSAKTHSVPYWSDWTVKKLFACHREDPRDTLITVTLERHVQTSSPNELLNNIKRILSRRVNAIVAHNEYKLKQQFHNHIYDSLNLKSRCANPASAKFEWYAPKVPREGSEIINVSDCTYCMSIPVNETQNSSFFITELYYCDHVVFNETEFDYIGKSVYVKAIGKVFHEFDYQVVNRDSQSFVHVCADKASYVPVGNPSIRVQVIVRKYILLVIIVIIKQTLNMYAHADKIF